jgi:hypothetical protein
MNRIGNEVNHLGATMMERDYSQGAYRRKVFHIFAEVISCFVAVLAISLLVLVCAFAAA